MLLSASWVKMEEQYVMSDFGGFYVFSSKGNRDVTKEAFSFCNILWVNWDHLYF